MKRPIALWIFLALMLVSVPPVSAHGLKVTDPEPDYVIYWAAVILYPVGNFLDHLIHVPHKEASSKDDKAEFRKERNKPKYNFSPREKNQEEIEEEDR